METNIFNPKRTIVARFDEGEDLLITLKKCAVEHGIKSGWFSLIGGLKEFSYGLFEEGVYRGVLKKTKYCFEIMSSLGNITMKEGDVFIHAHVVAADAAAANEGEGAIFGGHLMEGSKIYPFAEVVISEFDSIIDRGYDEKTKLWPMKLG